MILFLPPTAFRTTQAQHSIVMKQLIQCTNEDFRWGGDANVTKKETEKIRHGVFLGFDCVNFHCPDNMVSKI